VEREVLKYGEAPAGIKEVFELCRGFERAYVSFVNVRACSKRPEGLRDRLGSCLRLLIWLGCPPARSCLELLSAQHLP
jgi:hypothetical protein